MSLDEVFFNEPMISHSEAIAEVVTSGHGFDYVAGAKCPFSGQILQGLKIIKILS